MWLLEITVFHTIPDNILVLDKKKVIKRGASYILKFKNYFQDTDGHPSKWL